MSNNLPATLVTGAGGFIASHLIEALLPRAAALRAFVHYNSRGDPGLLNLLPTATRREIDIVAGDLRDLEAVDKAVQGCELVLHLGALISIPYSYRHPVEVVETNVSGSLNVLLAARRANVTRLVHTSTSEVYGTAQRVPIDEDHPLQGQSPYSASKIAADKLAESFYRSYDLPVVTLRPFNTYGPRQSARAVIPTIIAQALTQPEVRLGNLAARRDLTYVEDTVDGFLRAAQQPGLEGQTINLGSGSEITIADLAKDIIALIGNSVELVEDASRLRPEKSEVERLLADNSRAQKLLGWRPVTPLKRGLQQTIDWMAENIDLYQPERYQI
ncbi:MAG: GDP-mannose 4,6-dehydratase [Anaerolineales bacterium]|nr:GDP-mannose 4,6-dehydratase [Anaerolineales bacterium]